jgi:hypothetical protein
MIGRKLPALAMACAGRCAGSERPSLAEEFVPLHLILPECFVEAGKRRRTCSSSLLLLSTSTRDSMVSQFLLFSYSAKGISLSLTPPAWYSSLLALQCLFSNSQSPLQNRCQ